MAKDGKRSTPQSVGTFNEAFKQARESGVKTFMWKGKKYSGRPTMKNGLKFESSTSLSSALDSHQMFEVKGDLIYFENQNYIISIKNSTFCL